MSNSEAKYNFKQSNIENIASLKTLNRQIFHKLKASSMENQTKKFHFQEINKILQFPVQGNQGKYFAYKIQIKTPQTQNQHSPDLPLCQFLESIEVEQNYPHTVGYYKQCKVEGPDFQPQYLELRKIASVEEFWLFLNAVNL